MNRETPEMPRNSYRMKCQHFTRSTLRPNNFEHLHINMAVVSTLNTASKFTVERIRQAIIRWFPHVDNPMDWQIEGIQKALEGNDVIVIAGTGSGKSLIFQALAVIINDGIILIISPLKNLINEQVFMSL